MEPLSLLNDIIFKIVFGSESSRPVLRALLNALLGFSGQERIVELEILNPHLDKEHGRELTDVLELHFIELSKFQRDKPRDLRTPFEKWLHTLKFGGLYQEDLGPIPEVLAEEEGVGHLCSGELAGGAFSSGGRSLPLGSPGRRRVPGRPPGPGGHPGTDTNNGVHFERGQAMQAERKALGSRQGVLEGAIEPALCAPQPLVPERGPTEWTRPAETPARV